MPVTYYVGMVCLPIISLAATSRIQDTSAHVTYSTRAARASVVLKALGTVAKVDLQTSPQTENEVLVISVSDQPLSDVMARIATATSGEWKHEGSTYRLIASDGLRRKEERDALAKRTAALKKRLEERLVTEKQQREAQEKAAAIDAKKGTADKANQQAVVRAVPGGMNMDESSVITSLLLGLDLTEVAQIEAGDRIVFSSNPTRMQRPLGGDAAEVINGFIQSHNARVEKSPSPGGVIDANSDESGFGANNLRQMKAQNSKIGTIAKALLVAKHGAYDSPGDMSFELRLYDGKGLVAYVLYTGLGGSDAQTISSGGSDGDSPTRCGQTGAKVEYSTDSKAFIAMMSSLQSGGFSSTSLKAPADLLSKLQSPDLVDPLAFMSTDEVLAFAKVKNLPLVADIPDDWGAGLMEGKIKADTTVDAVSKRIQSGDKLAQVQDNAYTVLKPSDPPKSRAMRANRLAIAQLIKVSRQKGVPGVDDLAAFAMVSPDPTPAGIDLAYLALLVPGGLFETMSGASQWPMFRFYGSLSPEGRQTLAGGGRLGFANLSGIQKAALERMVYGADGKLTIEDGKKANDLPFFVSGMSGADIGASYNEEPTEVAPAGLPSDGFFEAKQQSEPFASPVSDGPNPTIGILAVLNPDELALFSLMSSGPGAGTSGLPTLSRLRIGTGTTIDFTFHLAPKIVLRNSVHDRRLENNAAVVTMNDLPADLKKAVDASLENLKKNGLGSVAGAIGGIHP